MSDANPEVASRLAGQSGLVMAGYAFTLLAGFPFQIFLARVLGAEPLGAFSLFEVIAQTVAVLAGLGLSYTMVRFIPEHVSLGQYRHVRQLLTTVFSLTLVIGICAAVLVTIGGTVLTEWMPELRAYSYLLPLVGAMTLLTMLTGLSAQALRAFLDIRHIVIVASFLQLTMKIGIAVVLLWLGWGLAGYLIAVLASLTLALCGMLWGLRGHVLRLGRAEESVFPETRKLWWSYSRTMYATSLLEMAASPVERFFIGGMLDLSALGIWTAVRQLQSLPQVFLHVVITVVAPMFAGAKSTGGTKEVTNLYHIATDWVGRLGFPLLVFLTIFGDQVLGLYGARFAAIGYWPLVILLIGQFINLATGPVGAILNMVGHEKKMLGIGLTSDLLYFACLLLLATLLGLPGVAAAGALSTTYLKVAAMHVVRKRLGIRWWSARNRRLSVPTCYCIVISLVLGYAGLVHDSVDLVLALAMTYAVFFIGYVSGGLTSEDKAIYHQLRAAIGIPAGRQK